MANNVKDKADQLDPGPTEIHWHDAGNPSQLVGYALIVQVGEEAYDWYIVMDDGFQFPLPNDVGCESCFKGIDAPESPGDFYQWVLNEGELGPNTSTHFAHEQYGPWNP